MAEDFLTGSVSGHRQFTGDELLKLTISPDLPDNTYKCKIYFGKLDRFESNGGVFHALYWPKKKAHQNLFFLFYG